MNSIINTIAFFVAGFKNVDSNDCFRLSWDNDAGREVCKRNVWALRGGEFRGWCWRMKYTLTFRDYMKHC